MARLEPGMYFRHLSAPMFSITPRATLLSLFLLAVLIFCGGVRFARQVESVPADAQTLALLEARFAEYLADPAGTASPAEDVLARLAERKQQWK